MSGENTSIKWWQTLPGILTAITATITAIAGLIAVLHQTGLLPSLQNEQSTSTMAAPADQRAAPTLPPAKSKVTNPQITANKTLLKLPANAQAKVSVGDSYILYTLVAAELEAFNSESYSLTLRARAANNYSYAINFWDRSFRLLVDGVAQSPVNSLNQVVDAQSAKEGDIVFIIPAGIQQAILTIGDPGKASTQIPLTF